MLMNPRTRILPVVVPCSRSVQQRRSVGWVEKPGRVRLTGRANPRLEAKSYLLRAGGVARVRFAYCLPFATATCKCGRWRGEQQQHQSGLLVACGKCEIDCGGALPALATTVL